MTGPVAGVRPAAVADADAIGEIHVASWQAAYAGLLPAEFLRGLSVADRQQYWARRLAEPRPGHVLVVLDGPEVAGFTDVGPSRDEGADAHTGELNAIYLHPERWRRGLGRQLHEHALAELAADGYTTATLWVLHGNHQARRFYQRAGWIDEGLSKEALMRNGTIRAEEVRYRITLPSKS
ncbi:MAG TPA: GNAT family N-acetyltransferase [Pseudonocardiaceae bacterium]|jgi:ribosomal protein S18 acetylase RimI-like enzyme|nr:GNAT family N-acetyltransferase [Pseudonocardiaceae bacterium]